MKRQKNNPYKKYLALILLPIALSAYAEDKIASVPMRTNLKVKDATGIIFSQNLTKQFPKLKIEQPSAGEVIVKFQYNSEDEVENAMVTALVLGDDGQTEMAPVRPLKTQLKPISTLPKCASKVNSSTSRAGALYQDLVNNRRMRLTDLNTKLLKTIDYNQTSKIRDYEAKLGYVEALPFDASGGLSSEELVFRLQRVVDAMKLIRAQKAFNQRRVEAQAATQVPANTTPPAEQ